MPGTEKKDHVRIQVTKNGPYIVTGAIPLVKQILVCDGEGNSVGWREGERYPLQESYALCRCGGSRNRPFCDGTHAKIRFDGTETASRVPYLERAEWTEGRDIRLSDAPGFCSHARFCIRGKGIWDLIGRSASDQAKRTAIDMAANCHSGRLVVWDRRTGKPVEPVFEKSIGLVEGPAEGVMGPLWVRGGIPIIAADGFRYEVRNRATLCRCGRSANKPFCDGAHMR
ncbi:MAG TPA: CDGSH iron-sulfur domain-containing protein [Methanomicrobiales archaeon]|nr:CDGSH iron-sulfur domain-containing protein [Methanomicrobiales archaeon]